MNSCAHVADFFGCQIRTMVVVADTHLLVVMVVLLLQVEVMAVNLVEVLVMEVLRLVFIPTKVRSVN